MSSPGHAGNGHSGNGHGGNGHRANGNGSAKPPDPSKLRRVVAGATVGTALEWYDFFIYGTAAALVFGDLFFSDPSPGAGTLIAVRDVRRRLRRAPVRRHDLRPSRRPHRPPRDADHHDAA